MFAKFALLTVFSAICLFYKISTDHSGVHTIVKNNNTVLVHVGTKQEANRFRDGQDVRLLCAFHRVNNSEDIDIMLEQFTNPHMSYATYIFHVGNKTGKYWSYFGLDEIVDRSEPGLIDITILKANASAAGDYQCQMFYRDPVVKYSKVIYSDFEKLEHVQ